VGGGGGGAAAAADVAAAAPLSLNTGAVPLRGYASRVYVLLRLCSVSFKTDVW